MTRSLMIQGVGSNVGKSLLCAGLCRIFANRGLAVAPFKPQNMSNNAAVAGEGLEIGRAQYVQAMACRTEPVVDMNPVLLKPEHGRGAQVIVRGKVAGSVMAADYASLRTGLLGEVVESYDRLARNFDVVICEGAGSPAETNLRQGDIANMGFACAAGIPVMLLGDIDRGGVIASLVGTWSVLDKADRKRVGGFIINKLRGDVDLFMDGYRDIERRTGWRGYGIVPWFDDAASLPAEDSVGLRGYRSEGVGVMHICCLALERIANYDDLDPLRLHPGVRLSMVGRGMAIPGDADLVIVPGSKSTRGDLGHVRSNGWDIDLRAHIRRGGHVLGICGGYQILGGAIHDPDGLDGAPGSSEGLGLLDVETVMRPEKTVVAVRAMGNDGIGAFDAYEIHMGRTQGNDCSRPFVQASREQGIWNPEGAVSGCGRVQGTYLHGLFADDDFRTRYLRQIRQEIGAFDYQDRVESTLERLAEHLSRHVNIDRVWTLMSGSRQG